MDWLQSLSWMQIAAIAGAVVLAIVALRDKLPGLPSLPSVSKTAEDPDVADLHALKRLEARAERSNCPKLKQAVRDVEVCFFNHGVAVEG